MNKEQNSNTAESKQLNIAGVSVRCCANCSHFNYEAPRFDQPYPEFWCGKEHWCGISNSEEYEGLNKPFECADFNAHNLSIYPQNMNQYNYYENRRVFKNSI